MTIWLKTPDSGLFQDLSDVVRLFYGAQTVSKDVGETVIAHDMRQGGGLWIDRFSMDTFAITCETPIGGATAIEQKRLRKRAAKRALYALLREATGQHPPWGSLTGIRPTRLYYEAVAEGLSPEAARKRLVDLFDVTDARADLIMEIVAMQRGVREMPKDMFDLYIGIPFCKTRCAYCSFSSGEIGDGKLVEPYVEALLEEISQCGALMAAKGQRVRALYVGGGTPTAIARAALAKILRAAQSAFPGAREMTVEAGRPDSLDREMLTMLIDAGTTRISINPQTFNDATLKKIGRAHTGAETAEKFLLARDVGFTDINMDLIAALPGETAEDFARSVKRVIALSPESVTVHALSIKRASRLHNERLLSAESGAETSAADAGEMIAHARSALAENGFRPYYLYRQKYMAGNLENVGYAKPGMACLYNIGNMEETARVLALGAGAITKWLFDRELRIERAPNVKNIEQYIRRVAEMVERKRKLILS